MSRFFKFWWIALVVKAIVAIWLPLSNDEAYYWVWGHHPRLSYFDHPPMVGWLFTLGTFLEDLGNAARLPGVILGHATLLVWHEILKPHLNEESLSSWLVFVLFSPLWGIGSIIITPDVPLVFFWSLSILVLLRMLERRSLAWYFALGATLGLGFCSKYLIVLFVPAAIAWIFWSGLWRQVRWRFVPATIVAGLLCCGPVILWNLQNDWASFSFQLNHGLAAPKRNPTWPLQYLSSQLALLFPVVVWFAARRPLQRETSFLLFFGWFPIAFFLYTSFKARVEANWPIMAYPALLSLAYLNAKEMPSGPKWIKATLIVWVLALILVLSQIIHPWIPVDPSKLKTSELTKYDAIVPHAAGVPNLYLGSYQMAAAVSYKLKKQVYKLRGMNRRDFYDFTPQSSPNSDRFFVVTETEHPLPSWVTEDGFEVASTKDITSQLKLIEVARREKDPDRK